MKNVNVKVSMNNEGQLVVTGINKDGSVSSVQYNVVETTGVREFAKEMMKRGIAKQLAGGTQKAERSEAVTEQPTVTKKEDVKLKKAVVHTKGQMFTNFKKVGTRAVQFDVVNKGECTIGFAKDRNVFMEAYAGTVKEITRAEVVRRLSDYEGKDARLLVQMINALKPVTDVAEVCTECKCGVTHKVKEYSVRNYGAVLCRNCQTDFGAKYKAERSEAKQEAVVDTSIGSKDETDVAATESGMRMEWNDCECGNKKMTACAQCVACNDRDYNKMIDEEFTKWEAAAQGTSVVSADNIEKELESAGVHIGMPVGGVVGLDPEDMAV